MLAASASALDSMTLLSELAVWTLMRPCVTASSFFVSASISARGLVLCDVDVFFGGFFVSHYCLILIWPLDVTHLKVSYVGIDLSEALHHCRVDEFLEERASSLEFAGVELAARVMNACARQKPATKLIRMSKLSMEKNFGFSNILSRSK